MDHLIKRWRWVMAGVVLFDMAITLIGQPASYWSDPTTVREGNEWFHAVMVRGVWVSVLVDVVYLAGCFLLVSFLPARLAAILMMALVLGHFFGGSTWICYRYGFGVQGVVFYAIVVSGLFALVAPDEKKVGGAE